MRSLGIKLKFKEPINYPPTHVRKTSHNRPRLENLLPIRRSLLEDTHAREQRSPGSRSVPTRHASSRPNDTELTATSELQYEFQRTIIPSNSDVPPQPISRLHANQTTTYQPEQATRSTEADAAK